MSERPVAIAVRGLCKSFQLPDVHRGRRAQLLHPVRVSRGRRHRVLDGISFDIYRGEFFGIVGRNGSGKSTLLRLLSSIYDPDAGSIEVRGRLGPFLELGVGFNPELSASRNVVLNGVMLGLAPAAIKARVNEVLAFADLEEFGDVQIKNFSQGMRVRLAFAVMVQANPDVFLVDEILAVGDAAFQEKCLESFVALRDAGKTIVLVNHSMPVMERYCDRAMLLEGGKILAIDEPAEIARRYLDINLGSRGAVRAAEFAHIRDRDVDTARATIDELWIAGLDGTKRSTLAEGQMVDLRATLTAAKRLQSAGLRLELRNERGARIFAPSDHGADRTSLEAGHSVQLRATIENRLAPGRYTVSCVVVEDAPGGAVAASAVRTVGFEVSGTQMPGVGLLSLRHRITFERQTS